MIYGLCGQPTTSFINLFVKDSHCKICLATVNFITRYVNYIFIDSNAILLVAKYSTLIYGSSYLIYSLYQHDTRMCGEMDRVLLRQQLLQNVYRMRRGNIALLLGYACISCSRRNHIRIGSINKSNCSRPVGSAYLICS